MRPKRLRTIYRILLITAFLSAGIYVDDIPIPGYLFGLLGEYELHSFARYVIGISFISCIAIKFYAHRVYKCPFCENSLDFRSGWFFLSFINAGISFIRFINIDYCSACDMDLTDPDIKWNIKM